MNKLTILLFLSAITSTAKAQPVVYNGPEVLLPLSTENYSRVEIPTNLTVRWTITGAGASIVGSDSSALVFYDVAFAPVTLTATLSNNATIAKTIPLVQSGANLTEGNIPLSNGVRQYRINQLLRGQRVRIKPINFIGANPQLRLLSSQGRLIAEGDSIDFRSPTRGLFYLLVNSPSGGDLVVEGVSPTVVAPAVNTTFGLTLASCTVRNLDFQIDRKSNYTGGEYILTNGNKIITCIYDFVLNKSIITAYENDIVSWTWMSNENEYIRTISADPVYGIAGVGSCGGALKNEDSVYVVKLNSDGIFQTRSAFATNDGRDYGYGISFLNDGSLMATGFTEGTFPGYTNAGDNGVLDAFAVRISATGSIINSYQFGSDQNDRIFASRTLPNGNILLFGDTEGHVGDTGTPQGSYDLFISEMASTGIRIKTTQYGSNENDLAFDFVVDPVSGDYFITGQTTGQILASNTTGDPDRPQVYTARINKTTHALVWVNQLGPLEGQSGESIALSPTGVGTIFYTFGSFLGATNNSLSTPASDDMVIALYDFNGNLNKLYQFDQTIERLFARAITFKGNDVYVLRDHVYEPGRPYITTSLDRFLNELVLPVTLVSFSAVSYNCNNLITWKSSEEINFKNYELTYSSNGNNFESIATINAKGNNSDYTFNHNTLIGNCFYRLKMIDKDNSIKYSHIISVNSNCNPSGFSVYPNPFSDKLKVANAAGTEIFVLTNSIGQTIYTGKNISQQDFSHLKKGIYFLKINANTTKLIKQ